MGCGFPALASKTVMYFFSVFLENEQLAQTDIQVLGQGGAPVPEQATMLLFDLGLAGVSRKKS